MILGLWILIGAISDASQRIPWPSWVVAPTYGQSKKLLEDFVVLPARQAGLLTKFNESAPATAWVCGQKIEARSWDSPQGLYGATLVRVGIDEFGHLNRPAWAAISSRVQETSLRGYGMIRGAGNVTEVGDIAEELYRLGEASAPGYAARTWTWRHRARATSCGCGAHAGPPTGTELWTLEPEVEHGSRHDDSCERGIYLRELGARRREMTEMHFRQLYGAEWVDWSALPAYTFDRGLHVKADLAQYQPELAIDLCCDFNVDPMAWTLSQHKGRYVWDFDEIVIPGGATTYDACNEMNRRLEALAARASVGADELELAVYGDRSGNSRTPQSRFTDYQIIKQELGDRRVFTLNVPSRNPDVVDRLNAVNAKFKNADGEVTHWIHPDCKNLIRDRARVSLKPGTREIDKNKDKTLTHSSDGSDYQKVRLYPITGIVKVTTPTVAPRSGPDPIMQERW